MLISNFDQIVLSDASKAVLTNLPFDKFKAICSRDDINVQHETTLLHLVKDYILKRDSLPPEQEPPAAAPAEEAPKAGLESEARQREDQKQPATEEKPQEEKKEATEAKTEEEAKKEVTEAKTEEKKEGDEAKTEEKKEGDATTKAEEKKEAEANPEEVKKPDELPAEKVPEAVKEPDLPYAKPEVYQAISDKLRWTFLRIYLKNGVKIHTIELRG